MEFELFFNTKQKDVKKHINLITVYNNVEIYEIKFTDVLPEYTPIRLSWKQPMVDGYSVWTPLTGRNKAMAQWNGNVVESTLYYGAPVLSLLSYNGNSNTTVAISDTVSPCKITLGVDDFAQKDEFGFNVILLTKPCNRKDYKVYLRIDKRDVGLVEAIQDVASWWKDSLNIVNNISQNAEFPLYSTWYNFHQNPRQDFLEKELVLATKTGLKTVILDDGWQFDGVGVGDYSCCGDWKVSNEKFPDFHGFVKNVHSLGMKLMVWFPVPFVGIKTNDYKKFENKLLYFHDTFQAGVLDIRYKDVREYISQIYIRFVKEYGIDGLKLDFIDSFKITADSPQPNENMDCKTVEDAVSVLLHDILSQVYELNRDFLIEFRQYYVGAEIVKFCNMLRVMDCAYDSVTNRIGIVDLRMLAPYTAIHSDMLLWAKNENPIQCARQLLNIMFGVPQISVLLTESTDEQLSVIKNYIDYWTENADVILHGSLTVNNSEANYSMVSTEKGDKKITVLYSENYHNIIKDNEDVFNATNKDYVVLESSKGYKITIIDVFGNAIAQKKLDAGIHKIDVCLSGRIKIYQ